MIRIGISGYGNVARGVELAVNKSKDCQLVAVFSRRNPSSVQTVSGVPVYSMDDLTKFQDKIDVLILCGGSATDLPVQGPKLLSMFNTVDSFDTHKVIGDYIANMDQAGKANNKLGVVSVGWDPGLFSILRTYFQAMLPFGSTDTFWGKGVSQGHSDAIRRVKGVKKGIQYTIPKEEALAQVRAGVSGLTPRQKHLRECWIVAEDGADKEYIVNTIKTMPNYFSDYDTEIHFISEEEFNRDHNSTYHGGFVLRSGNTSQTKKDLLELAIKLDSNAEFTGSIMVAYARAVMKLRSEGVTGALNVLDIAPRYLCEESRDDLIHTIL